MSFEILKDLYLFWPSFFESQFDWIFLAFSHMLSLTFSSCKFLLFLLNCFFIAFFAIYINLFALSQLFCSPSKKSSSFGNSVFTVKFPFYRCLPTFSSNKIHAIAMWFLLLYWNSAADNHSVQLSC